jgi:glycosyltransferase involved in cell wall biosynthesis
MKIAFIEPHLKTVGGIRRIIEISNRLVGLKHDVTIFSPTGRPCYWLNNVVPVKKLSRMHKFKFDTVVFNLAEQYQWALKAKAKQKVFLVLAAEALYKDPKIPVRALQQKFMFMANSKFTADYIKSYRKVKYDIPIIPGGINPEHFKFVPEIPKRYHILYYGSPRPWKGTHVIEGAFQGKGLKLLKMEGRKTPQHKMFSLYNGSTCFIAASLVEGFSFPELEAMACGCPVICTDSGGNRDFVKHGKNALVVRRDMGSLQKAALQLLSDKPLRRRLRMAGLETARNPKYSWPNITKRFEKILLSWL